MNKFIGLSFSLIILSVIGCKDDIYYEKNYDIPATKWAISDSLLYQVNIEDTSSPYHLLINIRNSTEYKYRNIYLFLKILAPNGKYSLDTVECVLADKRGQWLGDMSAGLINNTILYKKGVIFPMKGKYNVIFTQAMRENSLPGIYSVGLRVDQVPKNNLNE